MQSSLVNIKILMKEVNEAVVKEKDIEVIRRVTGGGAVTMIWGI